MIGILLAAGRGTRMKSECPKVLFPVNDQPLAFGPLEALWNVCDHICVVVGYQAERVQAALSARALEVWPEKEVKKKLRFVEQNPPQGTGDAVKCALAAFEKKLLADQNVFVVNGDLPLVREATLRRLLKEVEAQKLSSACLSMRVARPQGLGRILRDQVGAFVGIREEKDASPEEKRLREVNGGLYFFQGALLEASIQTLKSNNRQKEFYLTDLLGKSKDPHRRSEAICLRQPWDLMGVNTTYELSSVRKLAQARLQKKLCEEKGVDFLDPATAYISARSEFEGTASIGPGTVIRGRSRIGESVVMDGQAWIENSIVEKEAHILWGSVLRESRVGTRCSVGPMAHLRPESVLESDVKVGNFVEIKKSVLHSGVKASHLSYLGDAEIGAETNIGCGTITCNYDGAQKHRTEIGARAFIGSDSQLVAPVKIGSGAYVASGTTVTQDVPAGALAIARPSLTIKENYAERLAQKKRSQKK